MGMRSGGCVGMGIWISVSKRTNLSLCLSSPAHYCPYFPGTAFKAEDQPRNDSTFPCSLS